MIFLIAGASHTGKTLLAQKLLEKYNYPFISIDHLKMGLIRSNQTILTAHDDNKLTEYLWPIVREIVKTAIENKQNLIIEGCYIPYDWQKDFTSEYLAFIKYICLIFSENYIKDNYKIIMENSNAIENRVNDKYSKEEMIADNKYTFSQCKKFNCDYLLINDKFNLEIDMDIVCKCERLFFRKIKLNDYSEIAKMLQNIEIMYAWEHIFSEKEVHLWIEKRINSYNLFGYDYFLAFDIQTKEVVGLIGLLDETINGKHFAGIGYILKKEYWHKGFATEGAKAMVDYAFNVLKKDSVIATIRPENANSCNVAKRIGMRITSNFIKTYNGKHMKHLVYSINNNETK